MICLTPQVYSDDELIDLGVNWSPRARQYLVFKLKNGQQIQTPDYLSPINFRYSTLEGLKRYLKDPQKI